MACRLPRNSTQTFLVRGRARRFQNRTSLDRTMRHIASLNEKCPLLVTARAFLCGYGASVELLCKSNTLSAIDRYVILVLWTNQTPTPTQPRTRPAVTSRRVCISPTKKKREQMSHRVCAACHRLPSANTLPLFREHVKRFTLPTSFTWRAIK